MGNAILVTNPDMQTISLKLYIFSYLSVLTYVMGAQKPVSLRQLFEYPQHMFCGEISKLFFDYALLS